MKEQLENIKQQLEYTLIDINTLINQLEKDPIYNIEVSLSPREDGRYNLKATWDYNIDEGDIRMHYWRKSEENRPFQFEVQEEGERFKHNDVHYRKRAGKVIDGEMSVGVSTDEQWSVLIEIGEYDSENDIFINSGFFSDIVTYIPEEDVNDKTSPTFNNFSAYKGDKSITIDWDIDDGNSKLTNLEYNIK